MAAPYRYATEDAAWVMESGVWVPVRDFSVLYDAPTYGYNNWSEGDELWYQRGAGGTQNDWVKLGITDKYVTVTGYTPGSVVAVTQTGAHNPRYTRVSWTNPVGSTGFNIYLLQHNDDDPAYDMVVLPTSPGDTSYPNHTSGSAAGQHVWYTVHYQDVSRGVTIDGPAATSNTVITNDTP